MFLQLIAVGIDTTTTTTADQGTALAEDLIALQMERPKTIKIKIKRARERTLGTMLVKNLIQGEEGIAKNAS